MEFNEKVLYYFGNLKGKKWTEDDIELKNGAKLISKSNLSGIRGGAKLHKRYDLIVLDDFEDENNTQEQMGYELCLQCDGLYSDEELNDKILHHEYLLELYAHHNNRNQV